MSGEVDGVLVSQAGVRVADQDWIHVDLHIRRSRGVVEHRKSVVLVEQDGDIVDGGAHTGDIAGSGESTNLDESVLVGQQLAFQIDQVDTCGRIVSDGNNIGNTLTPGQKVRVVLVGRYKHYRLFGDVVILGQR